MSDPARTAAATVAGGSVTASATVDVAVIGCGGIAQAYLQAIGRTPCRLAAIVEPDPARQQAARGARTDLPAFADVEALLAAHARGLPFQAALVLTPPNTHAAIVTALLGAGVHVLCEKPLCHDVATATQMLAAATRAGRTLMMGSKFRYTPDIVRARELLDRGLLGPVLLFENVFCSRVDMSRRWNAVRAVAGGGVLIDNGCHSIDIARYLLGPIARVQAQFGVQVQQLEVEDTVRVLFQARSGTMGSIDLSWSLHKEVPSYVRIYGARGTIEVGWKVSRYKLENDREWTAFGQGYDKIAAFAAQLDNFAGVVLGTQAPRITAEDALASVQAIEQAYRSAADHKWFAT